MKFNEEGIPNCTGEYSYISDASNDIERIVDETLIRLRADGATPLDIRTIEEFFIGSVSCGVASHIIKHRLAGDNETVSDFFNANAAPLESDTALNASLTEVQGIVNRECDRLRAAGASGLELRVVSGWFTGLARLTATINIIRTNCLNRIAAREAAKNGSE